MEDQVLSHRKTDDGNENKEEGKPFPEDTILRNCLEDWNELEEEYVQLENLHRTYQKKLNEMIGLQDKCLKQIAHHRYRMKGIQETLKRNVKDLSAEDKSEMKALQQKLIDRKEAFRELEECLPHQNGLYLSVILGQVNVSLLNKGDKFQYKREYERFKLVVSYIVMCLSFMQTFFGNYRWVDAVLHFLLVWYYCTLTIRESILVVNGSRIKGWWLTHHFISTVCAGISLIWPDGWSYQTFRTRYVIFIMYLSFVYVMQYYYQNGCLYRLRTLGKRHGMDITVEGFMSWMWKGLAFLLPLLFFGYVFQIYNAYILWTLTYDPRCTEWQVFALGAITFGLAAGNTITTLIVIRDKLNKDGFTLRNFRHKYRFNHSAATKSQAAASPLPAATTTKTTPSSPLLSSTTAKLRTTTKTTAATTISEAAAAPVVDTPTSTAATAAAAAIISPPPVSTPLLSPPLSTTASPLPSDPPTVSSTPPIVSSDPPIVSSTPPTVSSGLPTVSSGLPTVSSTPPTVSSDLPTVSSTPPTVSSDPPIVSSDPPTVSSTPPIVSSDPPIVSSTPPTVSSTPPTVSSDPPIVSSDPPTVSSTPPIVSSDPPIVSSTPPTVSSIPPTISPPPDDSLPIVSAATTPPTPSFSTVSPPPTPLLSLPTVDDDDAAATTTTTTADTTTTTAAKEQENM